MGLFDFLFGRGENPSKQLPSSMVAKEFGEVNVKQTKEGIEVLFTILMEPEGAEAEGWQTGVVLDASASMTQAYGAGLVPGPRGQMPASLVQEYARKGWIVQVNSDGSDRMLWTEPAFSDAIAKGYLQSTENIVEPLARKMTAYLAGNLDSDGGTTLIYWACGDGSATEVVGDFTVDECDAMAVTGPKTTDFGGGTRLTPAVKYFVERFADSPRGMYIFITDGKLDDLMQVKRYTVDLAKKIAAKQHNPVKCVLIGVGNDIDEGQMEELDDLETGTDVDIWDHKIAKEMRSLIEIFAEVVSENKIVASTATIYDDAGNVAARYSDGLPAKVKFTMRTGSKAFELEVGGQRIRQSVQI